MKQKIRKIFSRNGLVYLFLTAALTLSVANCGGPLQPAFADAIAGVNPFTFTLTDPTQDGVVINGTTGTKNVLILKDHNGSPIAAVGEFGGLKVFGDNLAVNTGSDIFHSQVTISPFVPVASVCVRTGQLWVGGPTGKFYRCQPYGTGFHWVQLTASGL